MKQLNNPAIIQRTIRIKKELLKNNLDAVLISSVPNITYLTGYANFSTIEREAYLIIVAQPQGLTHETPEVKGYIITDGRYSEAVQIHVPHFTLIEISLNNPLKTIFINLSKKEKVKKIGIEENNITYAEYKRLSQCFNDLNHFSIDALRTVKDNAEVEAIEKACELGDKAFGYILGQLKESVTEKEIAFLIEQYIKQHGADLSFPTIVAFGKNSSIPHHQTSDQRLKTNSIVLIDFGVKLDNYCSDMTRTVFFGKATDEQKKMYQTVLDAQQKAIDFLLRCHLASRWHLNAKEVDKVAREYITSKGYPTIPHSLGHGIGLEVHEAPRLSPSSKDELKEDMVFSIEPGIYLPGIGGVRIEDLVVLESQGAQGVRLLTKSEKSFIAL